MSATRGCRTSSTSPSRPQRPATPPACGAPRCRVPPGAGRLCPPAGRQRSRTADLPRQPRHGPRGAADPLCQGEPHPRRAAAAAQARLRAHVLHARRAGRLLRRRGRDERNGRRPAARQDMFPTQVTDWQTQTGSARRRSAPVRPSPTRRTRSNCCSPSSPSFAPTIPALEYGATFIRYSHHGVLAMSRIDAAANASTSSSRTAGRPSATITFQTSTPSSSWSVLFGGGSRRPRERTGR